MLLASSAKEERIQRGCETLQRLDYRVKRYVSENNSEGYFSAPLAERRKHLQEALTRLDIRAVLCTRGGYGSTEILDGLVTARLKQPRIFCAFSDLTSVQIFLWQKLRWVTFYGPLVAGGFDAGPNAHGWIRSGHFHVGHDGDKQRPGPRRSKAKRSRAGNRAEGTLLGGCITLIETSIGTPWELDTRGSILLLEDRGVKHYQLDRMLLHLMQAGKFKGACAASFLGNFPESEPSEGSVSTLADVCRRVLGPLRIPMVYGAPVGHTPRPMLTLPLGVRAKLITPRAKGASKFSEPAVRA